MTHQERFDAAIAHREADRAPIDVACTSLTGMAPGLQARLLEVLGFTGQGEKANNNVDERLLVWSGSDFRGVGGMPPLRGPLEERVTDTEHIDCWGVRRKLIGRYWEIVESPLAGAAREDLDTFPWPDAEVDESLLATWREEARHLAEDTPYVVIGEHPVFGILELGCWMCGYTEFLTRLAMEPDFVRAFFERYFAIQMRVIDQYYEAIGEYIDLTMSGDDFGMQSGPLMHPGMFRELVAPWFTERIARTKYLAGCLYWHHSCGSIVDLLDDIIACGVDILNPVQTSAARMVPADLKRLAGGRLTFWGAVDVQDLLRTASPDQVREAVKETMAVLGREGGYVVAPAHNMQDDVPPENVVAMVETALTGR